MSNTEFKSGLPSMHCARYGCAAAALGNKIFVVGGENDGGKLNSGEMFDSDTNQWITLNSSMSTARHRCAAVSLGESIIVIGGDDKDGNNLSSVEEYDTINQRWSSFPSMNSKRWGCAAAVVDGKIIVVGGFDGFHGYGNVLASAEEYNPTTKKWVTISPMRIPREGSAATVLGGQLYVIGGYNRYDGYLPSAEVYDPATKQWTLLTNMNTPRRGCAATSLGGKVFVFGGWERGNLSSFFLRKSLSSCESFDTTTHQWSNIASMHTKRESCAAVEVGGTVYVMGGWDGSSLCSMESLLIQPRTSGGYVGSNHAGYYLQEKLGSGSFGTVFKAEKVVAGVTVTKAIKVLKNGDGKLRQMNKNEISILLEYRHENIACLHDVQETEKHLYLILDFCKGGNLKQLIQTRKSGKLSEPLIRWLMRDLGAGLKFLHGKGILHRDIKPQNLLLTGPLPLVLDGVDLDDAARSEEEEEKRRERNLPANEFSLKIADFGFARFCPDSLAKSQCGTLYYMAPEIKCGHRHGMEVDIYSTGKVLLEMITGAPSATAPDKTDLPNILDKADMSTRCLPLLELCLENIPEERSPERFFQACDDFVNAGSSPRENDSNE